MEQLKAAGIVKQLRGHIAVRNAQQNKRVLRHSGFSHVKIEVIPHYNILKFAHPLRQISGIFAARLWIEAKP
jgi:hypothetical protein